LHQKGITAKILLGHDFSLSAIYGLYHHNVRKEGLLKLGFKQRDIDFHDLIFRNTLQRVVVNKLWPLRDLKRRGISAHAIRAYAENAYSIDELLKAFSPEELREAGYSILDIERARAVI